MFWSPSGPISTPLTLVHSPIRFGWSGSSVKIWCCDTSTSLRITGAAAPCSPPPGEGVPLVMPMGADQFQNADALALSGAGVALPQGGVTAAAVDGVRQLMDDPDRRAAAGQVRGEILALADAGRADRRPGCAAGLTPQVLAELTIRPA